MDNNIKSNQEQAIASWIQYLNKIRFENFINSINQQDINLNTAIESLDNALEEINKLINTNRGGKTGIHGFIAEAAEVGIGNAKQNLIGNKNIYEWANDNGMVDLVRNGIDIQQKFYQSDLSLGAIAEHLKKYPNFIKNGGKYQIPKDQYDKIKYLMSISAEQANKMKTSDGTFSLKQWKRVQDFFKNGQIDFESVEPSNLKYFEVQKNIIDDTIYNQKEKIKLKDKEIREDIKNKSQPNINEACKITTVSAVIEGGTTFVSAIIKKKRLRKYIKNFDVKDWEEILKESGISSIKGGVRGISLYALTNYAKTPASIANSVVTASLGMAEQAHLYRKCKISEMEFIENSELLCLDASISALSSAIGQTIIPIPILGAVIGNTIGLKMYNIAKENFTKAEEIILEQYYNEIKLLENNLDKKYKNFIKNVNREVAIFLDILDKLYSPNMEEVFNSSVEIARYFGVTKEEILDTKNKRDKYFLD